MCLRVCLFVVNLFVGCFACGLFACVRGCRLFVGVCVFGACLCLWVFVLLVIGCDCGCCVSVVRGFCVCCCFGCFVRASVCG